MFNDIRRLEELYDSTTYTGNVFDTVTRDNTVYSVCVQHHIDIKWHKCSGLFDCNHQINDGGSNP